MDRIIGFLKDWAREYIKNRNIMTKSLVSIEENGTELLVKHKDREQVVMALPFMNSFYEVLKELGKNPEMHLAIVTFNSDKSFRALMDNWKELAKHRNLSIYFVNPFSQLDKKWIIFPYTHSKIC